MKDKMNNLISKNYKINKETSLNNLNSLIFNKNSNSTEDLSKKMEKKKRKSNFDVSL